MADQHNPIPTPTPPPTPTPTPPSTRVPLTITPTPPTPVPVPLAYDSLRPVQQDLVRSYAELYMEHVKESKSNNYAKELAQLNPGLFVQVYSGRIAELMVHGGKTGPESIKVIENQDILKKEKWDAFVNHTNTPAPVPAPTPVPTPEMQGLEKKNLSTPVPTPTPVPLSAEGPDTGPVKIQIAEGRTAHFNVAAGFSLTASTIDASKKLPVTMSDELRNKIAHASKGIEICATEANGKVNVEECSAMRPVVKKPPTQGNTP